MKVLFLNNYFYLRGGSERVLFEEMKILGKEGHEVAVFSRENPLNEPSKYIRYFPPNMETGKVGLSAKALRTVKEIVYSNSAKTGLGKVVEDFKPDITHAHNIYGRLSLSVIDALEKAKIPVVLTLHDYKLLCPSYLMLNRGKICEQCKGGRFMNAVLARCHKNSLSASSVYAFESWFNHSFGKYRSVNTFVSPSKFLRDKAVDFGWDSGRIAVIPNFIDSDKITPPAQAGRYLLYLGRLSEEKGVSTLLKAYLSFRATENGDDAIAPLVIAGDGPIRRDLENASGKESRNIHFVGYLSGKSLEDTIAGARAIVMPSEWYENAPLSLIEAFAYGKPVIGARIGGIPEMINDGINGLLFEAGNVGDLEAKIKLFLSVSDDDVMKMGAAARRKAELEYNPGIHYEKLLSVYLDAINNR